MFRFLGRVITIFIGCTLSILFIIAGAAYIIVKIGDLEPEKLPEKMVLYLDFAQEPIQETPPSPFQSLTIGGGISLREAIETIEKASTDPRVIALVARVDPNPLGIAQIQELREAIIEFSKQKPSFAFAESLGELSSGNLDYYLATGFKEIWLQPSGSLGLAGVSIESPFIKGTLELLGIQTEFFQRHEYKGASEMFTNTEFTTPVRESLLTLLNSYYGQIVDGISKQRGLNSQEVEALINFAPLLPDEAMEAGLIDQVDYWDVLLSTVSDSIKREDYIDLATYHHQLIQQRKPKKPGAKIALIYAVGEILSGESQGETVVGSISITDSIEEILEDDIYKAVVVRVDSPGGSYTASDTIWHDLGRVKEAGLPVYISMGNYAASGGYFIALSGTKIYADQGTLTGSIGIFFGKFIAKDFFEKLGITWDTVEVGPNTALWSLVRPLDDKLRERINTFLDFAYDDFTSKVAKARSFDQAKIDQIARGRIFTGQDAKDLGLVDELGGLNTVLKHAITEIKAGNPKLSVTIDTFPNHRSATDEFLDIIGASSQELIRLRRILSPLFSELEPVTKVVPNKGQGRLLYFPRQLD